MSKEDKLSAATDPSSAVVQIDLDELLRSREEDRVALRAKAKEIERQWEVERNMAVEAGKEEMAQQVRGVTMSRTWRYVREGVSSVVRACLQIASSVLRQYISIYFTNLCRFIEVPNQELLRYI